MAGMLDEDKLSISGLTPHYSSGHQHVNTLGWETVRTVELGPDKGRDYHHYVGVITIVALLRNILLLLLIAM